MALLDSELARIKAELGFNLLGTAQPYFDVASVFEGVIQVYLGAGATTTSATEVTAAASPTPVAVTLASGTGFTAGDRVVIDVDDRQEWATIQSLSGAIITVALRFAHSGTYPVTVEGGEAIAREILGKIRNVKTRMGETFGAGALKQVDEVHFYDSGGSFFGGLGAELMTWRDELAAVLGSVDLNLWRRRAQGAQRLSVY